MSVEQHNSKERKHRTENSTPGKTEDRKGAGLGGL